MKSHLNALKLAKQTGWANTLIVEDDAIWKDVSDSYAIFEGLVNKPYDVIMLGGTFPNFDPSTYKLFVAKTSSAYLFNSSYYDTLINKATDVLKMFEYEMQHDKSFSKQDRNTLLVKVAYDLVVFEPLQQTDSWYIVYPPLMIQSKSYSNIEKREIDYNAFFQL